MKRKFSYFLILVFILFLLATGTAISLRKMLSGLPAISFLEDYTPSLVTKIYDYKGNLISELFIERRTLILLKEIPVDLQNAVLATEDNNFFHHWGISVKGITRAAVNNLKKRRVAQGGSTITQQLAKTIFLTPQRTFTRKLKELLLTIQLEHNYSKEEIFQLYLNQIYFGSGAYGVEAAAKVYFSKHLQDLNLAESAMLAGLPRAPNYYSPYKNPEQAFSRRAIVLKRLRELNYITSQEENEANLFPLITEKSTTPVTAGQYFIEYVRLQLEPKYGSHMIYQGGLSVYTTLDLDMQKAAESALGENLTAFDSEKLTDFELNASTPINVEGSLVSLDPKTGGIRALVGGRDFRFSQFNRAIQAKRQPGSSFKPFIYTAAIDNGFTPATIIDDSPVVYMNDGRDWQLVSRTTDFLINIDTQTVSDPMKVWVPSNYGNKYKGKVLLRAAIENSINICAIQLISEIGPMRVIEYARKMGVKSSLTNTLSLALGSSDVTLLEIVNGYAVLASGGIHTQPYSIIRVEDKDGKILEENMPVEKEVLSPQTSYIMTNLLRGVVEHGTGRAARRLGKPCAGKTGTTNDFSDAWFIGYTPQLATGVWVGYDDRIPLGEKMSGGRIACPIWTKFMIEALKKEPQQDFIPPEGIVFCLIDPKTGYLALSKTKDAYLESFIKGTEPKDYFPPKNAPADAVEPVKDEEPTELSEDTDAGGY